MAGAIERFPSHVQVDGDLEVKGTNGIDAPGILVAPVGVSSGPSTNVTPNSITMGTGLGIGATLEADDYGNLFASGGVVPDLSTPGSSPYTLDLADAGRILYTATAGATFTIPTNASVPFPVGTSIEILNGCASGAASLVNLAYSGITVLGQRYTASPLKFGPGSVFLRKVATNTWVVSGSFVRPRFSGYSSGANVTAPGWGPFSITTENWDLWGLHSGSGNGVAIPAGWPTATYRVNAMGQMALVASNYGLRVTLSTGWNETRESLYDGSIYVLPTVSMITEVQAAAGQTIGVELYTSTAPGVCGTWTLTVEQVETYGNY